MTDTRPLCGKTSCATVLYSEQLKLFFPSPVFVKYFLRGEGSDQAEKKMFKILKLFFEVKEAGKRLNARETKWNICSPCQMLYAFIMLRNTVTM